MKFLSLFAGIGGFDLGLERAGMKCVGQVEIDPFCQKVLKKHWPDVPRFTDIRKFDATGLGGIDLICGGFPCQPWSHAGKQQGAKDDRDLWPEMLRIIKAVRPRWIIGENVRGFVSQPMGLDRCISDLEAAGYVVRAYIIPACAVDAPHRRDRVWIVARDAKSDTSCTERRVQEGKNAKPGRVRSTVAYPDSNGSHGGKDRKGVAAGDDRDKARTQERQQPQGSSGVGSILCGSENEDVAHAAQLQRDGGGEHTEQGERQVSKSGKRGGTDEGASRPATQRSEDGGPQRWLPEPDVGRVAHGVPRRVDRLRGLGNAVVPQVVEMIGRSIMEAENG